MIVFTCKLCRTSLSAPESQQGQQVRCPNCMSAVTVPAAAVPAEPVPAMAGVASIAATSLRSRTTPPPIRPSAPTPGPPPAVTPRRPATQYGKRYGFNCVYCSSRLEATETMAGMEGQCPTCGSAITIPILDRYGRLIDPITQEIIKQDPHPVHAYAAAGERAPAIIRDEDGHQQIVCNKCRRPSPISSNNCKHCGMPFTMEGTAPETASQAGGFGTASLVLGLIGLPAGCTMIVPLLAIVFGVASLVQTTRQPTDARNGRGSAITGIVCGTVGLAWGMKFLHWI